MNSSQCPTQDAEVQQRSRASRRRQRQRVVRAKMHQASISQRQFGDISGAAGLLVADSVEVFDKAALVSRTGLVPIVMAGKEKDICEGNREDFRSHVIMPCSNETLALMVRFGNPMELRESMQGACEVMKMLEIQDCEERRQLVAWLAICAHQLALSNQGCRVLQKAIEVVSNPDLAVLSKQLEPHVLELAQSPHGNFVLAKMIERLPPAAVAFVIGRLQGNASKIAQNKYGCRVLERLIEHCSEEQLAFLVGELVADADVLSRHQFGNFVVSHLLEHTPPLRQQLCKNLLPGISALAMHRSASHVVQKALDFSDAAMQTEIAEAFLKAGDPNSLADVACSRYGHYVVMSFARIPHCHQHMRAQLMPQVSTVNTTLFGKKVIDCFGLVARTLPTVSEDIEPKHIP